MHGMFLAPIWHNVFPEGSVSMHLCPGWEESTTILLAILQSWVLEAVIWRLQPITALSGMNSSRPLSLAVTAVYQMVLEEVAIEETQKWQCWKCIIMIVGRSSEMAGCNFLVRLLMASSCSSGWWWYPEGRVWTAKGLKVLKVSCSIVSGLFPRPLSDKITESMYIIYFSVHH